MEGGMTRTGLEGLALIIFETAWLRSCIVFVLLNNIMGGMSVLARTAWRKR